jgi:hypothetical protein
VLPCDAVALLRLEGDDLVPVAAHGLVVLHPSNPFDTASFRTLRP